ncbi:MAG: DUF234 domain-containing protein [Solirubrobacteraceae bacterium]
MDRFHSGCKHPDDRAWSRRRRSPADPRLLGTFAGRAVEPLVRGAIQSMLSEKRFGNAECVGSYWNRNGSVEIDIVGGNKPLSSERIDFVGSIKWRERAKLDSNDVDRLIAHRDCCPARMLAPCS